MRIKLYLHGNKQTSYEAAVRAGLTGEALSHAMYLGYEHEVEYEVNPETGHGDLIAVDGRQLLAGKS